MTWTFSSVPQQGGAISVDVRDPEFGDLWSHDRSGQRQATSDGGQIYIEDLPVEDRFLEIRWSRLSVEEWSGLLLVLQTARWQAGRIQLQVTGSLPFPVPLGTGMSIKGLPISTGGSLNTGQIVAADTFALPLKLDQRRADFEQQLSERGALQLRFRLEAQKSIVAGA